jgi:hypothetical protein
VPYKAFPTNEPSGPPPDYFHLDVSPGMFGAHIGKGLQQAGEGINKAADTWGEIQKDDVLNNAIKEASEATEEYSKLRGADALNGEQGIKDQLTQINDKYRSQLPPGLAHQFDQQFRPYRDRYLAGKISTHAISQGYDYSKTVNTTAQDLALNHAARNYNNPAEVENAIHDMRDASMKQLQLDGRAGDPNTVTEYMRTSDASVYKAAAEAQFQHDPAGALQYVEQHKKELGVAYAPLYNQFRARATEIQSEQSADLTRTARKLYKQDPVAAKGFIDANKGGLGAAYDGLDAMISGGTATPKSNVVPLRPGQRAGESEPDYLVRQAKERVEGTAPTGNPPARQPGESYEAWKKRDQSQNYSPAQKMSADYPPGLPFAEEAINYQPNPGSTAPHHQAPVRTNNPGAQWPNDIAKAYGSTGHENLADGNKIATFPTPIHGAAANMALLADKYAGMTIRSIQSTWSGQHRSSLPGYPPEMKVTREMLNNKDFMVTFMKNMAEAEAKDGSTVLSDPQWQQAFDLYQKIGSGRQVVAGQ